MIQVAAQPWALQAPHPASASPKKANGAPVQTGQSPVVPGRALAKPQFGGAFSHMMVNRALIPTFQNITEVFLWSFLAQDMVAMWMPRIGTSLSVGRVPYDPQDDPGTRNLPFHQQVHHWITGNVQGLNWVNFNEGMKREMATGPGLLVIPALAYLTSRRLFNQQDMELPFAAINSLNGGFRNQLATRPIQADTSGSLRSAYTNALAEYVNNVFTDQGMKQTHIESVIEKQLGEDAHGKPRMSNTVQTLRDALHGQNTHWDEHQLRALQDNPVLKPLLEREETLEQSLRSLFGNKKPSAEQSREQIRTVLRESPLVETVLNAPHGTKPTYGDYLNNWSKQWATATLETGDTRSKKLASLERDLEVALETFNRKHRILADTPEMRQARIHTLIHSGNPTKAPEIRPEEITDKNPLHNVGKTYVNYGPTLTKQQHQEKQTIKSVQKPLSQVTDELNRWSLFAKKVFEKVEGNPKLHGNELPNVLEGMSKKLVANKFVMGLVTTIAAGYYLLRLAFWAQNHDSYQETRLLKRKPANTPSTPGVPNTDTPGAPSSPAFPKTQPPSQGEVAPQGSFQVGMNQPVPVSGNSNIPLPPNAQPVGWPMSAAPGIPAAFGQVRKALRPLLPNPSPQTAPTSKTFPAHSPFLQSATWVPPVGGA